MIFTPVEDSLVVNVALLRQSVSESYRYMWEEVLRLRRGVDKLRRKRDYWKQRCLTAEAEVAFLRGPGAAMARDTEAERDRLATALAEALATFVHPTHPGRECRQSGHVPVETIRRWSDAILDRADR